MTVDDDLRAALHDDEQHGPDLDAVRRAVLDARGRRADRHRWWATGLVAVCVLVISGAVAMSAIGADEQRAGRDAAATAPTPAPGAATAALTAVTPAPTDRDGIPVPTVVPDPVSTPTTVPASSMPLPDPVTVPAVPDTGGAALLDLPEAGDQLGLSGAADAAARHCHAQVIAWPLVSGGRVDVRALRSAVDECAVGLGDRSTVAARFTVTPLADVASGTGLWAPVLPGGALPDSVDPATPMLVVRLEGSFPALAEGGPVVPAVVQLYVDARGKYWSGMQFRTPVDPDLLGDHVTVLPG